MPTTAPPVPLTSYGPVVLAPRDRGTDLQVRVTAPAVGDDLPIVVFSHGFGHSMAGYGPIVDAWAAAGLVVVQPTHLDSASLGLAPDDPRTPHIWRHRIEDVRHVIDDLAAIASAVPGLASRIDRERVAVAGHSYGATTVSALLGAGVPDADDLSDARVTAGVLLALAGTGDSLTPFAAEAFPFMHPTFDRMQRPALLVAGDHDQSLLSTRGPDWWRDGFEQSPGDKALLTLHGAEHSLGGIDAYAGIPQSPPESPALLALVQRTTSAYLRAQLGLGDDDWTGVREELADGDGAVGRLEER